MQFTLLAVSAILGLAAAQYPSKPCSHMTGGVHVIAAPGEGSANPPYGLIGSLSQGILNALPGSSNISLPYNHDEVNGVTQTQDGSNTLDRYIREYQTACPNTRIVLLGYSAGAVITMNTVCGTTSPPYTGKPELSTATYGKNVIAIVTYGDQTRVAGQAFNKGTCTQGAGAHPRRNPAGCNAWASKIRGFCDYRDPQCCQPYGTNQEAHYGYPAKYDQRSVNFVVAQAKKFGI